MMWILLPTELSPGPFEDIPVLCCEILLTGGRVAGYKPAIACSADNRSTDI